MVGRKVNRAVRWIGFVAFSKNVLIYPNEKIT